MKRNTRAAYAAALAALFVCGVSTALAKVPPQRNVPVVMLSDIHFDPFQDPAKVAFLSAANVSDWDSILSAPASGTQKEDFAKLQSTCKARGVDSSYGVLEASLKAAHSTQPTPLFVTVSGDLLVHGFDCRLRSLAPSTTPNDLESFAQKTFAYVALKLRESFPGVPVYISLGNNDSGCANHRESPGSQFLQDAALSVAADVQAEANQKVILAQFVREGDYNVPLPSPMQQTRLVVLQNSFQSSEYEDCEGKKSDSAAAEQIAWLRLQLEAARKNREHVWVMAHIPPGLDLYATFHKFVAAPDKLCADFSPKPMLSSDALSDTLTEFADVVRLAIFAHTHLDEMKLLHNGTGETVPVKVVPAISRVNGNNPAFTVAQVNTKTAVLVDYSIYVAGSKSGDAWSEEYKYSSTYNMADYSADSVGQITSKLAGDRTGASAQSRAYQKWFYAGNPGTYAHDIQEIWPAYACATRENGGPAFQHCMCSAHPETSQNARKPEDLFSYIKVYSHRLRPSKKKGSAPVQNSSTKAEN